MNFSQENYNQNPVLRDVFDNTRVLRKPITGIVSGYHELVYILIAPDDEDNSKSVEINGKINVSPRFIISSSSLNESYEEVFDPGTFNNDLHGRFFTFAYSRKKNLKVQSEYLVIKNVVSRAEEYLDKVHDDLMRRENLKTGLIYGPAFQYYPVSVDRFLNEIIDREFRV